MKQSVIHINTKECAIFADEGPLALIVQPVDSHDLKTIAQEFDEIKALSDVPFTLVALKVDNWNNELTPWAAPSVFKNKPFGDGAGNTLEFITKTLMPEMVGGERSTLLAGYSLAGLFSLWAAYNSNEFYGVAAVSPSLWYDGWSSYASSIEPYTQHIYLSLGTDEEKARNKTIASVGEAIRRQHSLLQGQGVDTTLVWNEGNHFHDPAGRMAHGIAWLLNRV